MIEASPTSSLRSRRGKLKVGVLKTRKRHKNSSRRRVVRGLLASTTVVLGSLAGAHPAAAVRLDFDEVRPQLGFEASWGVPDFHPGRQALHT